MDAASLVCEVYERLFAAVNWERCGSVQVKLLIGHDGDRRLDTGLQDHCARRRS